MRKLLLLLLCITGLSAAAQFPIGTINISMPPNPAANIAAWGAMPPVMITAQSQLRQGQMPPEVQECRILVTIKQGGNKKYGLYNRDNAPTAGFNNVVRNWSGASLVALIGDGIVIAPGQYELCVEFFTATTPTKSLSNEVCRPFTVKDSKEEKYNPPVNVAPVDKKVLSEIEAKAPVTFRWTPLVPRVSEVTYRLKVWQLMQGQNGTQAMRSNQPVQEKEVKNITQASISNLYTGPCKPPYMCNFIWQVEAVDGQGKSIALGEATSFSISEKDLTTNNSLTNISPSKEAVLDPKISLAGVNFRWTPLVPKPQQPVTYRLKVWQLMQGQTAMQAMRTSKPIITKDVDNVTEISASRVYTGPCKPPYMCIYMWQVEAIDVQGKSLGISEGTDFSIAEKDLRTNNSLTNISPSKEAVLDPIESQAGVNFRWTPITPRPQSPVTYRLKVWQLMEGQTAMQAMKSNKPFIDETIKDETEFAYRKGWDGKGNWLWQVEATAGQGKALGVSEANSFGISNQQTLDCCKGGTWGNELIEGIPQVRCGMTLPTVIQCNAIKNVNFSYSCGSSAQCTAQIIYAIKDAAGNTVSSVTSTAGSAKNITMPATPGFYCLTAFASCNDIICDSCKICFKVECNQQPESCCVGSRWLSKSISWPGIKDGSALTGTQNEVAEPSTKKVAVGIGSGEAGQMPTSVTINKCDSNYHLGQGGTYTFNADFQCAPGSNCTKKLLVKIKGIGNSFYDGTFTMPKTISFSNPGVFAITYIAVCGGDTCARCPFTLTIDKNCCTGSKWNRAEYQVVNLNPDGSWDRSNTTVFNLLSSGIPTLKADLGFTIQNLNYQCANQSGCAATYIIKRKNLLTGAAVVADETLPLGQNSTSIYSKPFPQLITIVPLCGGQTCGKAIIFKVECLSLNCTPPSLPACSNCDTAKNLVINGDFESGNTAFTSGLTYSTGAMAASNYFVNLGTFYPSISSKNGIGKYYNIIAYYNHLNELSGRTIWKPSTPINTKIGSKYSLCFDSFVSWESNPMGLSTMTPGDPSLELEVFVNGTNISGSILLGTGSYITSTSAAMSYNIFPWQTRNFTWTSTTTSANIELKFKSKTYPQVASWNFGLDDITFKECSNIVPQGGFGSDSAHINPDLTVSAIVPRIVSIGDTAYGGVVAYILQPGDNGYSEDEQHGLIAAPYDIGHTPWGCNGTYIPSTSTSIGSGHANTVLIKSNCSSIGIPARLCGDLVLNGYSDWYLPSRDELYKFFPNKTLIPGFGAIYYTYWSSSQLDAFQVYFLVMDGTMRLSGDKLLPSTVRPVRSF